MRILIVEDNARFSELLANALEQRGYSCDQAATLDHAETALAVASYDAMILDLGLPDGDGRQWLADRPERHSTIPVIMLTARGSLQDRVIGLDAGADDYLVKPVEIDELAARLRALLRRPGNRSPTVLTSGHLSFDTLSRMGSCGDTQLDLTRKEAALLELLLRREGSVVPRAALEDALYNFEEPVTSNALEAVVSRLRRKLEVAGEVDRLHTIRGVGYMLSGQRG